MKKHLRTLSVLALSAILAFVNPISALADGGEGGHGLEVEVNGYHVTLSSQQEWGKGENVVVVTITDAMGMPVSNAEVEILITPRADSHTESGPVSHGESEADPPTESSMNEHEPASSHGSMSAVNAHEQESSNVMAHEEAAVAPLVMQESHELGEYVTEIHLKKSGEQVVQVFFHVDGEMIQADFTIDVPGMASKTVVLWGFLLINVGLVVSAGIVKNQAVSVKEK